MKKKIRVKNMAIATADFRGRCMRKKYIKILRELMLRGAKISWDDRNKHVLINPRLRSRDLGLCSRIYTEAVPAKELTAGLGLKSKADFERLMRIILS